MSGSRVHGKNPERVASGLKATIHNPNVSEGAKQRARERLDDLGVDLGVPGSSHAASRKINDNEAEHIHDLDKEGSSFTPVGEPVYEELEEEEEDFFEVSTEDLGVSVGEEEVAPAPPSEETGHRVLGGYKATLHNPRVSKEAKAHAKKVLKEHGAL
ncbi:hypothetical protein FA15DRAFT_94352 [Coprinopsis marcescibilis]|uniref:Conidiation protein 6 n=1 Tax=Coprinopsis marcescibilis TaxID=230819 RepID=A0A5C3KLG9_COPMA|nr:hypothetical protein FA15DRAFT_94352 [Coprinopsis marcescibilis]